MIKVSTLKKNPKNPRQIKGEKLELLKKSVGSFQKMMALRPMIVDENNVVLGGNMRLAAIRALGLKEIPDEWVKRADDLTEDEKAEFVIKDNNSFGEYDWDAIANEWDAFPLSDWGLDVPGFETVDEVGNADAEPQIDKAAELNKKWGVVSGDLWQIGEHRLLCGDSTKREDVERLMGGTKADFGFADPPYNLNIDYGDETDDSKSSDDYENFSASWFALFSEYVTGTKIVTPGIANLGLWHLVNKPDWVAAGVKMNGQSRNKFGGTHKWEPGLCWDVPYDQGIDVFQVNNEYGEKLSNGYHPVSKPTELLKTILGRFEGKMVYEPFGGCGTTVIACENLNKPSFNIEIHPEFCAVILERMQTAFPDIEIKRIEQSIAAKS